MRIGGETVTAEQTTVVSSPFDGRSRPRTNGNRAPPTGPTRCHTEVYASGNTKEGPARSVADMITEERMVVIQR